MKRMLVWIDEDAVPESIGLLEVGRLLYGNGGFRSHALAAGSRSEAVEAGFDVVFRAADRPVPNHSTATLARCIEQLHRTHGFDAIVVPGTHWGRMIAPRAAMRLGAGLVADVTGVEVDGAEVLLARPAMSGRAVATIACTGDGPVMMSVRPRVFTLREPAGRMAGGPAEILDLDLDIDIDRDDARAPGVRLLERMERPAVRDIRDSAVLVAGGAGAIRDFGLLQQLATALGGMVAASRTAVDMGAATRDVQVGQSGRTVTPRLYIAVGISGSPPHVAGIRSAGHVISVNRDPHAPIGSVSDVVVEGDGRVFLEGLLARIHATAVPHPGDPT